jgi:ABC-type antimicrobial peptide transport system permease subunit
MVVTVAGILDLLLSAILERRRELGLWRVIGADESSVRLSVMLESATIGVMGSALGIVVGAVTTWIWVGVNFRYLLGYYLELHLAYGAAVRSVLLTLGMTIVAGYLAARRATREPILTAIHAD